MKMRVTLSGNSKKYITKRKTSDINILIVSLILLLSIYSKFGSDSEKAYMSAIIRNNIDLTTVNSLIDDMIVDKRFPDIETVRNALLGLKN